MRTITLSLIIICATAASAQQPVYLCGGTYTDQPCKGGKEVDIAPTRGAHSMSGTRRESTEAILEGASQRSRDATVKGQKQGADLLRCAQLYRQRLAIDRAGKAAANDGERFKIREEQFALKCRRT